MLTSVQRSSMTSNAERPDYNPMPPCSSSPCRRSRCTAECPTRKSNNLISPAAANGFWNLDKHVANLRRYGQHIIVCFNQYKEDTPDEIEEVRRHCQEELHVDFAINNAFTEGGKGAEQLAETVVKAVERRPRNPCACSIKTTTP